MQIILDGQNLKSFPSFKDPQKIYSISLAYNSINAIPSLMRYSRLERLALNDNKIKFLCVDIKKMKSINWLDLTRNELDHRIELPHTLYGLGLSENNLSEIPKSVFSMFNLRKFGFFNNNLTVIPHNFFPSLQNLTKLDFSSNFLENLPGEILLCKNLRWLNLSNNRLKKIPDLSCLKKLEELGLGNNDLCELPEMILPKLKILPLYKNKIQTIKLFLPQVEKLDFSDNQIEQVEIYAPVCRYLNLKNNRIKKLNRITIYALSYLDISHNCINYVPYHLYRPEMIMRAKHNDFKKFYAKNIPQLKLTELIFSHVRNSKILIRDRQFISLRDFRHLKRKICNICEMYFFSESVFVYEKVKVEDSIIYLRIEKCILCSK